ncbi:MAG: hypothetical protein ACE5O2_15955 [Armatimonadota bacterium]
MSNRFMRCPHCHNVTDIIWTGYASDWVFCRECQRRIRWFEVESGYLLTGDEAWATDVEPEASYH